MSPEEFVYHMVHPFPGCVTRTHVASRRRFVLSRPEYAHFMNLTKELLMHLMDPWMNAAAFKWPKRPRPNLSATYLYIHMGPCVKKWWTLCWLTFVDAHPRNMTIFDPSSKTNRLGRLVVWNMTGLFSHILGIIIPTDFHSLSYFSEG